jgi:mono/diheme cytochrome c family protein
MRRPAPTAVPIALVAGLVACSGGEPDAPRSDLAAQGERVYQNVCVACHHGDPSQDGSLGPAVAGASAELLEFRLIRGGYPPGYTPKRPGEVMPRFEYLADQIPALAAYLAEAKRADGGS